MGILNDIKLNALGLKCLGKNVRISDKASFHNPENISLGNDVRIDDFCVLSAGTGGIRIGNNVHIAVFSSIIGAGEVSIHDFSNISSRVSIYSSSDDYSGKYMTNPTVSDAFKNVDHRDVFIGKHAIIGCGSVILPGSVLNDGVAIGALSLVNGCCDEFSIYAGNPLKFIRARSRDLLVLEKSFLEQNALE
jgi:dTDP-4-amino-4,6-dideoxy-D-glucose acyltransferase